MFKRPKKKKEDIIVEADTVETKSSSKDLDVDEEFSKEDIALMQRRLQESEDLQLFLRVQRGAAEYALFKKLS